MPSEKITIKKKITKVIKVDTNCHDKKHDILKKEQIEVQKCKCTLQTEREQPQFITVRNLWKDNRNPILPIRAVCWA